MLSVLGALPRENMFPRVVCWEEKADRLCAGGHVHVSQEGFHCDVAAAVINNIIESWFEPNPVGHQAA